MCSFSLGSGSAAVGSAAIGTCIGSAALSPNSSRITAVCVAKPSKRSSSSPSTSQRLWNTSSSSISSAREPSALRSERRNRSVSSSTTTSTGAISTGGSRITSWNCAVNVGANSHDTNDVDGSANVALPCPRKYCASHAGISTRAAGATATIWKWLIASFTTIGSVSLILPTVCPDAIELNTRNATASTTASASSAISTMRPERETHSRHCRPCCP